MVNINFDNLIAIIDSYKLYFANHYSDEIYKWKAIKHFQRYWNIEADDFQSMLAEALGKTNNLLSSINKYPKRMLDKFCEVDSNEIRNMFQILYDETEGLTYRIDSFKKRADNLLRKWNKDKHHYQDYNAITTYLWLRYPDKYYIYKYSCAKALAEKLDSSFIPSKGFGTRVILETFDLYNRIADFMQKDSSIYKMIKDVLTDDCYQDEKLRTTVVDLAYFIGNSSKPSKTFKIAGKTQTLNKETSGNYWWLCANPRIWSMNGWTVGEVQDYTLYNANGNKRRIFQNFLNAKAGDKVICYETNPTKQITALASISKESDNERIYFKKEETLTSPIDLSVVKSMPELANMEFLVNPNGSFFHLTLNSAAF